MLLFLELPTTWSWPFRSSNQPPEVVVWEEEQDIETNNVGEDDAIVQSSRSPKKRRDLIWLFGPPKKKKPSTRHGTVNQQERPPHPLRTEQWEIDVHWRDDKYSIDKQASPSKSPQKMVVDFAINGYLRARSDHSSRDYTIGQWEITPTGLTCKLNSTLLFHADLHLNPFGKHPKLTRGVIVDTASVGWKQKRQVVGTFTGKGVGKDTVDLAYRLRK